MSRSLDRLATVRARLKRWAAIEHDHARRAHEATERDLAAQAPPTAADLRGRDLHAYEEVLGILWRQEDAQRRARTTTHERLLHEVGEHKKVEKILAARAEVARRAEQRREARTQEAWLRNRLFAAKRGL